MDKPHYSREVAMEEEEERGWAEPWEGLAKRGLPAIWAAAAPAVGSGAAGWEAVARGLRSAEMAPGFSEAAEEVGLSEAAVG